MKCLLLALALGCQSRTEIVIGVATDLKAKGQIDSAQLIVSRGGTPILMPPAWPLADVPAGQYELPGSFGIYSPDGSESRIELAVTGTAAGQLVTQRDSIVSLVSGQTLFLRLSIVGDCGQLSAPTCAAGETCIEGVCRPVAMDSRRLPAFRPELVASVECDSGTHFIVSSTGAPMPTVGSGCSADEFCQEGTCYQLLKGEDAAVAQGVWTQQMTPTTYSLRALWGTPDGADVFAVGDHGTVLHLAGAGPAGASAWTLEAVGLTTDDLYAVGGTAATDVWAGGANGTLLHRGNGGAWSLAAPMIMSRIDGLSVVAAGSVWLAGRTDSTTAVAFHFDGSAWRPVPLPATGDLRAVFAAADSDVWLAGHGNLLHGDGTAFTARTLPAGSNLSAVAGAHFVGLGGLLLDGDLQAESSPVSVDLFGVWASPSGDEAFAVGDFGAILHLQSGVWSVEASGTRVPLRAVWGSRSGHLYALGGDGVVLHNHALAQPFDGGVSDGSFDASVDLSPAPCAGPADCPPACSAAQLTPRSCAGGSCVAASPSPCPDALGCAADGKSCLLGCATDGDCQSGRYCDPGGTCRLPAAQGSYCDDAAGAQCNLAGCAVCAAGLFCTDHVCCNRSPAQCGGCMQCTAPTGTCVAAPFGQDVHAPYCELMSGGCVMAACDGQGSCGNSGDACGLNACDALTTTDVDTFTCQSGACVADAPTVCPGAGCSAATGTCPNSSTTNGSCTLDAGCGNTPGGHCDGHKLCVPGKIKGSPCNPNSPKHCATAPCAECAAGLTCVDGFCCDAACNGACQACDLPAKLGTCSTVTSGQPHGARAACSGSGACLGFCDGSSPSLCKAASGPCAPSACSGANNYTLEQAASCVAGACPAAVPVSCQPFACVHAACRARCAGDSDCASTTPACDLASGTCH